MKKKKAFNKSYSQMINRMHKSKGEGQFHQKLKKKKLIANSIGCHAKFNESRSLNFINIELINFDSYYEALDVQAKQFTNRDQSMRIQISLFFFLP